MKNPKPDTTEVNKTDLELDDELKEIFTKYGMRWVTLGH